MDKIVETRLDKKSLGFNSEIRSKKEEDTGTLLAEALPHDFVKFGLIPELVGRVPVVVSLELLKKEALVQILTEPKSAIVKQYKKLLALDGVELEFEKDALEEIADITMARKTGARGLRAILEKSMMNIMYEVPSNDKIKGCKITKAVISGNEQPEYSYE